MRLSGLSMRWKRVVVVEGPVVGCRSIGWVFPPAEGRDDVHAVVAVDIAEAVAVHFAFGADDVFDEPGGLCRWTRIQVMPWPGYEAPVVAEDVVVTIAVDIAVDDAFHAEGGVEAGGFPFGAGFDFVGSGVLVPEGAFDCASSRRQRCPCFRRG